MGGVQGKEVNEVDAERDRATLLETRGRRRSEGETGR